MHTCHSTPALVLAGIAAAPKLGRLGTWPEPQRHAPPPGQPRGGSAKLHPHNPLASLREDPRQHPDVLVPPHRYRALRHGLSRESDAPARRGAREAPNVRRKKANEERLRSMPSCMSRSSTSQTQVGATCHTRLRAARNARSVLGFCWLRCYNRNCLDTASERKSAGPGRERPIEPCDSCISRVGWSCLVARARVFGWSLDSWKKEE